MAASKAKMHRFHVPIPQPDWKKLKREATKRGIGIAELMRRIVSEYLRRGDG